MQLPRVVLVAGKIWVPGENIDGDVSCDTGDHDQLPLRGAFGPDSELRGERGLSQTMFALACLSVTQWSKLSV